MPETKAETLKNNSRQASLSNILRSRTFLLLFLFSFFVLFFNLQGRTVENKDYVRYPEISRRILELSDWTVMHLNGRIYDHKPPFHFWSTAVAYRIFGVNAFAARVPSALSALLSVVALYVFCASIFNNRKTALIASLALLSSYGYLWWGRRTRIDMVFSSSFSIALLCFYAGWRLDSSAWKKISLYLVFWGSLAVAVLTKAHVAFIAFPVLIIFCSVVFFLKRSNGCGQVKPVFFLSAGVIFLIPIAVWIAFLYHHPEVQHYVEKLNWTRFKSTMNQIQRRDEGMFYYIPQFLVKLSPFVLFFFPGVWGMFTREKTREYNVLLFSLLWFLTFFVILNLTSVKDDRYLLPVYIPCAIISSWAVCIFDTPDSSFFHGVLKWSDRILFYGALAFSLCPPVWALYYNASFTEAIVSLLIVVPVMVYFKKLWSSISSVAGIFISFILVILVVDLCDTARNSKVSGNREVFTALQERSLDRENLIFFRCRRREHEVLAFYFNSILERVKKYEDLFDRFEKKRIRGVVTPRDLSEEVRGKLSANVHVHISELTEVELERNLVLFMKKFRKRTNNEKEN